MPQSIKVILAGWNKAWQMFGTGAYTKADILRLLRSWGVRAYRGQLFGAQLVDHIFQNSYYAGVLHDPWNGDEFTGRHTAMVSVSDFARVQEIVAIRNKSAPHHRLTDDFPLRGRVRCPSCTGLMTGYFAQGRNRPYPYYKCFQRNCSTRTKSYAAATIHDEFAQFLAETSVPRHLGMPLMTELVSAYWDRTEIRRRAGVQKQEEAKRLRQQLRELISMRAEQLVTDEEFVDQREHLRKRLSQIDPSDLSRNDAMLTDTETVGFTSVLSDLGATWQALPAVAKRGFGDIVFPAGYVFRRVRTADKGLIFKAFAASPAALSDLVPLIKANSEHLITEIRRLLDIIHHAETLEKKAA